MDLHEGCEKDATEESNGACKHRVYTHGELPNTDRRSSKSLDDHVLLLEVGEDVG